MFLVSQPVWLLLLWWARKHIETTWETFSSFGNLNATWLENDAIAAMKLNAQIALLQINPQITFDSNCSCFLLKLESRMGGLLLMAPSFFFFLIKKLIGRRWIGWYHRYLFPDLNLAPFTSANESGEAVCAWKLTLLERQMNSLKSAKGFLSFLNVMDLRGRDWTAVSANCRAWLILMTIIKVVHETSKTIWRRRVDNNIKNISSLL